MMPLLGLGTWGLWGSVCSGMVEAALRLGYRHIDTASKYGNEKEVGDGLRAAGVPRSEVFVTTKLWPGERSVKESLARLRLAYADLLLLHWPDPRRPLAEALGDLTTAQNEGLTRYIGVSNFGPQLLEEAVKLAPIANVQALYDPEMHAACRRLGLSMTAYSPISRGPGLRFLLQQGIAVIPRTSKMEHLLANMEAA